MRLGVLAHGFVDWAGGIDFLRLVVESLQAADPRVSLHLLVPDDRSRPGARELVMQAAKAMLRVAGRRAAASYAPGRRSVEEVAAAAVPEVEVIAVGAGEAALLRAARTHRLDALMPAISALPERFPVPWVGYIPDLQYRHLPAFFSWHGRLLAAAGARRMLRAAPVVVVNAQAVVRDIARFHPGAHARVVAMPFGAAPHPSWLGPARPPAEALGIAPRYLIVCNQFWKHKDHATAFEAFARIAGTFTDVDLVCTGALSDHRDPDHVARLRERLAALGVASRVHLLGLVPKAEQIALLKGAVALVQPTLFEGGPGGGAAYDAVSLGVPALLSDIPVNRELHEPGVSYFGAGDPAALALALAGLLAAPEPPRPSDERLREAGRMRRRAAGAVLLEAVAVATRGR
ncbi:MAG: glycosyltransferase [Burkholderiales bacterium]|nr:glycosyltransferase [Burkholderiales bacterium]